jgi:uncharacterized protein
MTTPADKAMEDAIVRIGKVISVKGRAVEVEVDKSKNTSHLVYRGELLKNIAVGGYVKIVKGFTRIIGKVEGESVSEDRAEADSSYRSGRQRIRRVLSISLLGFFKGDEFERGIKELPLLDNECLLLQRREFEQVHNFIRDDDDPIVIGELSFEKGQEIRVGVNGLFASHIGIFGNTGSGKSYTLAKLYCELFRIYAARRKFRRNARFFLIDFNGEYAGEGRSHADVIVDRKHKQCYRLSTRAATGLDKIRMDREALKDADFWIVFLEATEKTQAPFLRRSLANRRVEESLHNEADIKALIEGVLKEALSQSDKNIDRTAPANFLKEFAGCLPWNATLGTLIDDYQVHLKWHSAQNKFYYQSPGGAPIYSDLPHFQLTVIEQKVAPLHIDPAAITPVDRIKIQIVVQYYLDVIRGFSNREHLAPLIKRLDRRVDDLKKVIEVVNVKTTWWSRNLIIVSLKDVNIQMRKVLPLLLCKKLYADHKAETRGNTYLNIIVDEAHNILSEKSDREAEQWKDYRLETFEEIIKEGRKFGVFLTVASQRPADISPTIISQLHNYFLHRLINNEDINAVKQTISYLDRVSFESLPMLPTGTCVFAGLVAALPIVLDVGAITPARHEPRNKTMTLTDKW